MRRMIIAAMLLAGPAQAQSGFDIGRSAGHFGFWLFQNHPPQQYQAPQAPPAVYAPNTPTLRGPAQCVQVPYDVLPDGRVLVRTACAR